MPRILLNSYVSRLHTITLLYRMLISGVILVTIVGLWYLFFFSHTYRLFKATEDSVNQKEVRTGYKNSSVNPLSGMIAADDDVHQKNFHIQNMHALIIYAEQYGLTIEASSLIDEYTFQVICHGSYQQILTFFDQNKWQGPLVKIETIELSPIDNITVAMTLRLTI